MSNAQSIDTSSITYELMKARNLLKQAEKILLELEVVNYKVLGDFQRIKEFLREEIKTEEVYGDRAGNHD